MALVYYRTVKRVLQPVLQVLIDATEKDRDKYGWATLHELLAENATVTRYRLTSVLWLESVELYWHDCIVIDTQGAGRLEFSDGEDTVTLEFPRNIRAALCNGIETFAQDQLEKAVDKYGI